MENKPIDQLAPLVSVSIVTYNHNNFIIECLNSILMQKTNFQYEIILGEDESTDGTREICVDYAKKYPDKIRLFLRSRKDVIYINKNATGRFNFIENLKLCNGTYIALCDGDDYWTDPFKLQKQVDFLAQNKNYNFCGHDTKLVYQDGSHLETIPGIGIHNRHDIITNDPFRTLSMLFRKSAMPFTFPEWFEAIVNADWALRMLLLSDNKQAMYLPDVMGVHNIHKGGIWSLKSRHRKALSQIHSMQVVLNNLELTKKEQLEIKASINRIESSPAYYNNISIKLLIEKKIPVTVYLKYIKNKLVFYLRNNLYLGRVIYPKIKFRKNKKTRQ